MRDGSRRCAALVLLLPLFAGAGCADRSPPARFPAPPPPELAKPVDASVPIDDAAPTQDEPVEPDAAPK